MASAEDAKSNVVAGPLSPGAALDDTDRRDAISGPHHIDLPLARDKDKLAFTLEHVLGPDECERLIRAAEAIGFAKAGLGSNGAQAVSTELRDSGRLISEDVELAKLILKRVRPHLPTIFQGRRLVGLNEQLKFLRYHPGQKFLAHFDGAFCRPNTGNRTFLTLQLYLSQGAVRGGATNFCGAEPHSGVRCEPLGGRALVFRHKILHEGEQVEDGVKYTIRTDVEYGPFSWSAQLQECLGLAGSPVERRRRLFGTLLFLPPLLCVFASRLALKKP